MITMSNQQYMLKSGTIVSENPLMIEYPKDDFERLEGAPVDQLPETKYFSPFRELNDFLGTNKPEYDSVYIWITYDKDKNVIQNPSMRITDDLIVI